jgi:DNA-directed RNA polymerase sigma subunit (sigma70/sigma32)
MPRAGRYGRQRRTEAYDLLQLAQVFQCEIRWISARMRRTPVGQKGGERPRLVSRLDIEDKIADDQVAALIRKEEMELVQHNIAGALTGLNEKEAFIIQHRVMADIPLTLQAIGDRYHITRERARQIEKQALRKLALAIPYLGTETKLIEA